MTIATLLIFAKLPRAGRSKTRLGRSIGMVRAANLFRIMTMMTLDVARQARARMPGLRVVLVVDPPRAVDTICRCWGDDMERIPQSAGDLGVRMSNAMARVPHGPVLIIGTDAPQLRPRHIVASLAALKTHDCVFGPAFDGGYWLAGFAQGRPVPGLFDGVRWSSATALEDTIASLPDGTTIARLEVLRDIDEREDLDALGWEILMRSCQHKAVVVGD